MGSLSSPPPPATHAVILHPDTALRNAMNALHYISEKGVLTLSRTPKTFTLVLKKDCGEEVCRFRGDNMCHALQGLIKKYEKLNK